MIHFLDDSYPLISYPSMTENDIKMSKIFHRKSKMSGLNNIVDPQTSFEQAQHCVQEINENHSSKRNRISDINEGSQLRTIQHLKTYPIVQETQSHANKCAVTRVFIANAEPVIVKIVNSKPVKIVSPITNFADKIGFSSLKLTEKLIPSIKTKTFKNIGDEIMIPFRKTRSITKRIKSSMVSKSQKYVYAPTHSRIVQFRKYYNEKVYDTKGKPIFRGAFDPVILPLNNVFENSTHKYFPDGKTVNGSFSCEFDRSVMLSFRLIQNIIPSLGSKTKTVILWPLFYLQHVNYVLNKHLDMESNLCVRNSGRAAYGSVKELYHEFINSTRKKAPLKYFTKRNFEDKVDITTTNPVTVHGSIPHTVVEAASTTEEVLANTTIEHVSSPIKASVNTL